MEVNWNKEELRSRTQMDEMDGVTFDPSNVIVDRNTGAAILDDTGKNLYLNLDMDEIKEDFISMLEDDFDKNSKEYISDNGLISVKDAYGMGEYVSLNGYAKMLEERIGSEFGILEMYLQQVVDENHQQDGDDSRWIIGDSIDSLDNYVFKKIISEYSKNIDENEKVQIILDDAEDYISLSDLIELAKSKVKNEIFNRREVLLDTASEQELKNPLSEIELSAMENSEQIIEIFSDNGVPVEEKRSLYEEIERSANYSKRNMISIAILPIVNSLLSGKILTSDIKEYREQLDNSLSVVNNDLLDGILPDHVITTVKAIDAATRLADESIQESADNEKVELETEIDTDVMEIIKKKTKTITAHINLGYYYDPGMTRDEVELDLENIELPSGYKEGSFKFDKLRDFGIDENGVKNENMAICSIEMDFIFLNEEPHEVIRKRIDEACRESIEGRYRITKIDGMEGHEIEPKPSFDVESDFETPWHEYHTAVRATEEQFWKALDALKTLKVEAAKGSADALSTLSDLYRSGVAGVFMMELYGSEEISEEERQRMSDELWKEANPGVDPDEEKKNYLNSRYDRAMDIRKGAVGIEYTPEELFELLLDNAESGHVPSMLEVATLYESGDGVSVDDSSAEYWYSLAKSTDQDLVKSQAKKKNPTTHSSTKPTTKTR